MIDYEKSELCTTPEQWSNASQNAWNEESDRLFLPGDEDTLIEAARVDRDGLSRVGGVSRGTDTKSQKARGLNVSTMKNPLSDISRYTGFSPFSLQLC